MTTQTESRWPAEFVLSEANGHRSRASIAIGASQTIVPGEVLGKLLADKGAITVGSVTFAGTGNGTLTKASPAYGAGAQEGTYKAACIETTAAGGQFQVIRPDGTIDGQVLVGVAYDGQVKFTIADGSTDFVAGDEFSIPVAIADPTGAGKYVAFNQDGTDGSEIAAAIALYDATTGAGETVTIAAIVRDAEVNSNILTWPSDIETAEKAVGIAQLATLGVIVR